MIIFCHPISGLYGLVVMIAAFHLKISGRAEFDSPCKHRLWFKWTTGFPFAISIQFRRILTCDKRCAFSAVGPV
jgi:hypothetical protein